ncbi:hypothetical protein KM043_009365 [Ampulex compressa]|nr:hypothetical protein KM043_009365 [Ampulex compressa]
MTSTMPEDDNKGAKLKQKLMGEGHVKEETRSFLSFSRENLSISHSDLEQGFNKHRFRPSRNTILSVAGLLIALLCLSLETWKLRATLVNAREIEQLKRDVESLKHRFLEEDLLDELKAFEEQLYAEESNDEDNPFEVDIENADYDSDYDDDVSSSDDYTEDYYPPPTYGSRPSDFPESGSTIEPVPSPPDPSSNKTLTEFLAALRKVQAERGQGLEKNSRDAHRNTDRALEEHRRKSSREEKVDEAKGAKHKREVRSEAFSGSLDDLRGSNSWKREKPSSKGKRSVDDDGPGVAYASSKISGFAPTYRRADRNQTRRMIISRLRSRANLQGLKTAEGNDDASIARDRHPPKKYHAHDPPEAARALPSAHQGDLSGQIGRASKRPNEDSREVRGQRFNWRIQDEDSYERTLGHHRAVQISGRKGGQSRRSMARRHLRTPKQVYAIHYGADSTLFSEEDEHTGNGRAKHNNGIFRAWRPSDWVGDLGMHRYFTMASDGKLTVHESGLYLAYAQIHYLDEHDENAFHLLVNGRPIFQCTIYSPGVEHKSRSCFSAQVAMLHAGDRLVLKEVGSARYTLFQQDKSFFGLAKLGEMRLPQAHPTPQPPQLPLRND